VGSLSDLMGRRYVAILGAAFVVLGMIICSTAHTMNIFIAGMVFAGVGAGINELTALAVTSELAPTAKRGKYVAVLILTIIPFCPSVLWGQLIASKYPSAWRWIGVLCGIYNFIGLVSVTFHLNKYHRLTSQISCLRPSSTSRPLASTAKALPGSRFWARSTGSAEHSASRAW